MSIKVIATNRKARHQYQFYDTYEAGLVLRGSEIKSIRAGRVSLQEGFVIFEGGEAWLVNVHIAPYDPASRQNHDPRRRRKLLLHRREIDRLAGRVQEKGFTVVPTKLYLKGGRAKVEIALVRGKKQYDKRQTLAKRDSKRRIERAIKERYR
ncbi:MAG TPA: SsrA-binding protein SmpB [Anaerolineae bacterium]|nr:SsrA-binding protein SmpB [Anaerolineae bacterium]